MEVYRGFRCCGMRFPTLSGWFALREFLVPATVAGPGFCSFRLPPPPSLLLGMFRYDENPSLEVVMVIALYCRGDWHNSSSARLSDRLRCDATIHPGARPVRASTECPRDLEPAQLLLPMSCKKPQQARLKSSRFDLIFLPMLCLWVIRCSHVRRWLKPRTTQMHRPTRWTISATCSRRGGTDTFGSCTSGCLG